MTNTLSGAEVLAYLFEHRRDSRLEAEPLSIISPRTEDIENSKLLPHIPCHKKMLLYLSMSFFAPSSRAYRSVYFLAAPFAQVFRDSECSTAFSLRKD
jgi:hypothetical protein